MFGTPSNEQLAAIISANPDSSAAKAAVNPAGNAVAAVLALLAKEQYCPPPVCDMTEQTTLLLGLLDSIYSTVDQFFPVITIVAKQKTAATASTYLTPRAFARVYWAQQHKGVKFGGDPPNPTTVQIHLLQLKDIYLMTGQDLTIEPLFLLLTPAEPSTSEPSTSEPSTSTPP